MMTDQQTTDSASPFREVTVTLRAYEWVNILNRLEPHDPSTRRLIVELNDIARGRA